MNHKSIFLIGFLLFFSFSLVAQKFHYGALVGYNIVHVKQFNLPYLVSKEYILFAKRSFNIGGFVRYQKSKRMAFVLEPGYFQKRIQTYSYSGTLKSAKTKLHYLQVPALIQFSVDKKIHFVAGPEFGFLLSSQTEMGSMGDDFFTDLELSAIFGLYYNVTQHIGIGLRYSMGLTPMSSALYNYYENKVYHNIPTFSRYFQTSLKIEI